MWRFAISIISDPTAGDLKQFNNVKHRTTTTSKLSDLQFPALSMTQIAIADLHSENMIQAHMDYGWANLALDQEHKTLLDPDPSVDNCYHS